MWSPDNQSFLWRGPAFAINWTPFSDQSYRTLDESLIRTLLYCCLLAEPTSLSKKKTKNEKKLRRSKWSLIRPNCDRTGYDQTQVRLNALPIRLFKPNCPLTRPTPDYSPDCSPLELPSRPCNFGLGTHGCALGWVWS